MGRVNQYFQYVRTLSLLVCVLIFLSACAPEVQPPNNPLLKRPQGQDINGQAQGTSRPFTPCDGIKLVAPMSAEEFRQLFDCLNREGALETLKPIIIHDARNNGLFVRIYNEAFEAAPETRNRTLRIARSLYNNGGLDDLLSFVSEMITEFIDDKKFGNSLKPLLEDLLRDDLDLLGVLKDIVNYPESRELFRILRAAFDRKTLKNYAISFGELLRNKDANGKTGAENLVQTTRAFFELSARPNLPFTLEDLYVLSTSETMFTDMFLKKFSDLKKDDKKTRFIRLISDLVMRQTTSIVTAERRELLEELSKRPYELTPWERAAKAASEEVLSKHPTSDLSTLIKAASSLHRGLMEDERDGSNQDLLASVDIFIQGVKTVFDIQILAHNVQGPDAEATKRVITYKFYTNIAHREIMDPGFHAKTLEEKVEIYKNEYANDEKSPYRFYGLYIDQFEELKIAHVYSSTIKKLVAEGYSEDDAEAIADKRRWEFIEDGLEEAYNAFETFLDELVPKVIWDINKFSAFLTQTPYDFLMDLKEVDSIALFLLDLLINLKSKRFKNSINRLINGPLREFFKAHQPVDEFLRSQYKDPSEAAQTTLSYTISKLIWGFKQRYPMKDQITIISILESTQVLERLLIKENRIDDIRNAIAPFILATIDTDQGDRILRFLQLLHSGQFSGGYTEAGQLANQIRPILLQMIDTGFFKTNLDLLAALGSDPNPSSRFLKFLTERESKRDFFHELERVPTDSVLDRAIRSLVFTATTPEDIPRLLIKIDELDSDQKESLRLKAMELFTGKATRVITPVIGTLERMSLNIPEPLTNVLMHLGNFMTRPRVTQFMDFLKKFDTARQHHPQTWASSSESFLTQLIKRDEMAEFIQIVDQMLADNMFKDTHLFFREMIRRGELKSTIDLMINLFLHEGEQ